MRVSLLVQTTTAFHGEDLFRLRQHTPVRHADAQPRLLAIAEQLEQDENHGWCLRLDESQSL